MKSLLAHILGNAAKTMWAKEPTLGKYTSDTDQHELNLAFHYASELRSWFPWLDCDFDLTKPSCNRDRPDLILHRRITHDLNFLVVEIKRVKYRNEVQQELSRIRENWFEGYGYRFGAVVILNDDRPHFEVQTLCREMKNDPPTVLTHENFGRPLRGPIVTNPDYRNFHKSIRQLEATPHNSNVERSAFNCQLDAQVKTFYEALMAAGAAGE